MDLETTKARLNDLEVQISDLQREIKAMALELEEAEAAQENAKKAQNEFEEFVSRRKQAKDRNVFTDMIKSFQSFLAKANNILTGNDYWRARDRVDELSRLANAEVKRHTEDLLYCKKELRSLEIEREEVAAEYKAMLASADEEGATA